MIPAGGNTLKCGDCAHLGAPIRTMNEATNPLAYCAAFCVWRGLGEVVASCDAAKPKRPRRVAVRRT